MHTKTKALVGTVALALALQASASTTTQAVSGSQTNNENGCVNAIGIFTTGDCSYGSRNRWGYSVSSRVPDTTGWTEADTPAVVEAFIYDAKAPRVWIGPLANQMYYETGNSPIDNPSGIPTGPAVGDNKVALGLSGVLTIDDNGTTNGDDDLISGTIVIAAGTRNVLTGQAVSSRVEESWDTLTQTLDPTTVSSAAANGSGGFDYVIASRGMPEILQPTGLNDQAYPSETASSPILKPAVSGWVAPDSLGRGPATFECLLEASTPQTVTWNSRRNRLRFGSTEGANCADPSQNDIGATTVGVFEGYSCQEANGNTCRINGAILGTPGNFFTPPGDPGYQNLLIAVSTDGSGHIVSSFAMYSHQYEVLQGLFGFDTPYEAWDGGNLTLAGAVQAGSVAVNNDINPKSNGVVSVDLYSNDNFDATQATNLAFGPGAADITHNSAHAKDLNGDGVDDLQMHFRQKDANLICGDTSASLTGNTGGGDPFATSAPVLVKCD
jgi:hypothetical protein